MYSKFIRECPTNIISYLQYKNKINLNPWEYTSYQMCEGSLDYIAIIDFLVIRPAGVDSHPFIIDLREYFEYYRKLKLDKLKKLI